MAAKKRTPSTPSTPVPASTQSSTRVIARPNTVRTPKHLNYFQRTWIWYESSFAISMLETVSIKII